MCNVNNLCRLCATANSKVTPIFGNDGVAQNLADKIHTHLPIVVTPEDCMPTMVCSDCISALNVCQRLLSSCVAADERLRQLLGFEEDPDHTSALVELKKVTSTDGITVLKPDLKGTYDDQDDVNDASMSDRDNDTEYVYDEVVEAVDENGHPVFLKQEILDDEEVSKTLEGEDVVVVMLEYDPGQNHSAERVFVQESLDKSADESHSEKEVKKRGKTKDKVVIKVPDFEWSSILMCDNCGDSFRSLKQLFQHKLYAHDTKDPLQCPLCQKTLTSKRLYVQHVREHLPNTPLGLICPICSIESKSRELLKHHMKGHANVNNFDCQICCESLSDRAEFETHLENHAEQQNEASLAEKKANQQWVCHECGYSCSRSLNLQRHLMRHEREKSLENKKSKGKKTSECRVCGKQFESFWYLVRHRTDDHTKEELEAALQEQGLEKENFECNVCGKLLSCQYTLNHHLEAHSGIRNFKCSFCDKGFAYKAQLKSHMLIHTGTQYNCSECPKQFRNAYALRVHKRTHTGEKPFKCEQCPKAFHSRANFEQHLQIHSEVRKYKCNYCSYKARRPEALKTHIRTHTNERPYACKVCGRAFKQKYDCKKHEDLHYRNPGAFLKQRWPKCTKNTITLVQSDDANSDTQQTTSHNKSGAIDSSSVTVVQVPGSDNSMGDESLEHDVTESAIQSIQEVTEDGTEGVTKIYEYHEGGVREIVISEVTGADEAKSTVIWKV